jgi:hypothetical protein
MLTQVDSKSESHDVMSLVSPRPSPTLPRLMLISLTYNKALVGSPSLLFKALGKPRCGQS